MYSGTVQIFLLKSNVSQNISKHKYWQVFRNSFKMIVVEKRSWKKKTFIWKYHLRRESYTFEKSNKFINN